MKNNRRIKMIAWIMAAVMLLCTMPVAAMAGVRINAIPQAFMMDYQADVSYTINGDVLLLTVSKKEDITFSDTMYYKLPVEVESASSGQSTSYNVSWDASADGMMVFHVNNATNKEYFEADVSVTLASDTYDLYNIVKVSKNGTDSYYRLAKTKIKSNVGNAASVVNQMNQRATKNVLTDEEYEVDEYNFSDLDITLDGITYKYVDSLASLMGKDSSYHYYTMADLGITAVKDKIGGGKGWLVDKSQQYNDNNKTTGFHRDFLFVTPSEQTLYNFLHYDGDQHYYRLKTTKIVANSLDSYKNSIRPSVDEYYANPYNFNDLILTYKGEEYRYSSTELNGLYENYYTVTSDGLIVKDKIHEDKNGINGAQWLKDSNGFLDGSESDYEGITNTTKGYHMDYKVVFHKGNATFHNVELHRGESVETLRLPENNEVELPLESGIIGWSTAEDGNGEIYNTENPLVLTDDIILYARYTEEEVEKEIIYHSSLEGIEKVFVGTEITLSATIVGYEEPYTLQWEYEDPKNPGVRHEIKGETSISYTFGLDTTNCTYTYFIKVIPVE